jgi:YidC/Oxa1 family membrane protein insertase
LSRAKAAYRLNYSVEITNLTDSAVTLPNGIRLVVGPGLGESPVKGFGIAETLYSFVEPVAATTDNVERFHLIEPGDSAPYPPEDNNEKLEWFGLHSRYFALLIAPRGNQLSPALHFHISEDASDTDSIPPRFMPELAIDLGIQELGPGESVLQEFLVFSGPKSASALQTGGGSFGDLLFSGLWQWMRGLSIALLWVLDALHWLIPSWGITIILLAILVRILLYPVATKALVSQKAFAEVQKKIQPEMHDIKQGYSGGEQSEMILELYERHGVSPLAGLKPLLIVLIQIPIFVALFHALGQAYELKDASFLWIDTLAEPDRLFSFGMDLPFFGSYFNVLPVIMAVTTLLTIKFSPAPTAEQSSGRGRNIFYILMAFGFFALFYPFPSGMVLYWTMANMLHLLQQVLVETNKTTRKQ